MFRMILATVFTVLMFCQAGAAQQSQSSSADQDEPIRLKADLVDLRVVITDRNGRFVGDLKREDFEILDEGKHEDISFFSLARVARESASRTNGQPRSTPTTNSASTGSTIVLLVDSLHLSSNSLHRVKQQLKQFIDEQITDEDSVAVIATAGAPGAFQQFVKDRRMLKYAIDRITPFRPDSSLFTPYVAAAVAAGDDQAFAGAAQIIAAEEGPVVFPGASQYVRAKARQVIGEAAALRKAMLATLKGVCETLASLPGQRMVVVLSDGFTLYEDGGSVANSEVQAVTGRASRSGIVIYALDARGLSAPPSFTSSHNVGIDRSGSVLSQMSKSDRDQQDVLKTFARDTGGEAYLNSNDLNRSLQKMLVSNATFYELAYYPAGDRVAGKFRTLTVSVKNHPEYVVRAQRGYSPFEPSKQDPPLAGRKKLIKAMTAPLAATEIRVTSSADFIEREADNSQVSLRVHFDGASFEYPMRGQRYSIDCEVLVAVHDTSGKLVHSVVDAIRGPLTEGQLEQARREGYLYARRIKLKPGLYQVRVGVEDRAGSIIGTATSWVEVPNLAKGKLAMSSLFLAREVNEAGSGQVGSIGTRLTLGKASFKSGDAASYRFVAYNASTERPALMRTEILQGDAVVYEGPWKELASRAIGKDRKGTEIAGRIELGLSPGLYELKVALRDESSKKETERRVPFEVEP